MGVISTVLGFTGFGFGFSAGTVIGYFLFIYVQPTDVKSLIGAFFERWTRDIRIFAVLGAQITKCIRFFSCIGTISFTLQLLLNDRIPDAHIMKRWTRDARDVLPLELKAYQKDHSSMQSNTFRHRLLQLQSVKLQAKGDSDIEMFDIVMKHMRAAEKVADELAAKRLQNPEPEPNDDSTDEDGVGGTNEELAVQSDGGILKNKKVVRSGAAHIKHTCTARTGSGHVNNNRYGAFGSSAHYSDSEIVGMKAPYLKRPAHRPRNNRFHAGSESRKKKWLKTQKGNGGSKDSEGQLENGVGADGGDGSKTKKGSKREIKCGKCRLKGHKANQCCNLPITEDTAAAYL